MQTGSTSIPTIPYINTQSSKTPDLTYKKRPLETYTDPQHSKSSRLKHEFTYEEMFNKEAIAFGPLENPIGTGSQGSVFVNENKVIKVPHSTQHKKEFDPQILKHLRKYPRLFSAPITNGYCEIQQNAGPDLFAIVECMINSTTITNIDDPTIKTYLKNKQYDELLLRYLTPISEGIKYLHDNNIIHGDIKLENLGKKIIDFGDTHFMNKNNFVKGTPNYMHPVLHQEIFPLDFQEKQLRNHLYQKLKPLSISNETYLTLINITCENPDSYFISKILTSKKWLLTKVKHQFNSFQQMLRQCPIGAEEIFDITKKLNTFNDLHIKLCQFNTSHNAAYLSPHEKHILYSFLKNETLAHNFNTLNVETLKYLHDKTNSKISNIDKTIKEHLSSQEIESLTCNKEVCSNELRYLKYILETIAEYKHHEAYYKTHYNSFVTNPCHKKSYDIYALSLSMMLASLACLNTQYTSDLVLNIYSQLISKETIPQEINRLMQARFGSCTTPAAKLIKFILEEGYLSSDIKTHTDSAKNIHEFILSLNPVPIVSGSDTSSESSDTTSESSSMHKSRHH